MRTALFLICLLVGIGSANAQASVPGSPITGLWLTQDHDGIVQIYNCGDGFCGRIIGFFLGRRSDPTPRDYRGASQCGLPLIEDARPINANLWKGRITDPRNGRTYGVEMHITPRDALALRGFLGIPLLGQTQRWTRFNGYIPPDCRIIMPPSTTARNAAGG